MVYRIDMKIAARRLSQAAEKLCEPDSTRGVAAYLLGLAAECALKSVATGIPGGTDDAIQRAHFPPLRTALRQLQCGRRGAPIRRLVDSDSFMREWDITIRYSCNEDLYNKPFAEWRKHSLDALGLMEEWS